MSDGFWDSDVDEDLVGLIGARSLVGTCLLPLIIRDGRQVLAFSRHVVARENAGVHWQQLSGATVPALPVAVKRIAAWICVAPIWVLPEHFPLLEAHGVRRIVTLSSTSCFTKSNSSDQAEQEVARRLVESEARLREWAAARGIDWIILRPTLIYGNGQDKNISEIVRFIRRFGFFPLLGLAGGLRQPVHAEDVASACFAALKAPRAGNRAYNLSGGETLGYREMVCRVFAALGRSPRLLTVPLSAFRAVLAFMRLLPRYRHWTAAMAERMNRDLVFDHVDASRDLDFSPRAFVLSKNDIGTL
ncbi:MAG: epimerase [Herminiimonas sp.]|nr:epimerase [Herminiimonas sp.]